MKKKTRNSALRDVPYMGVIWVVAEAMKLGFYNGNPEWSNLGQGQPEVGDMEGAPSRISSFDVLPQDHAYGPLSGSQELRECIAAYYNRLYRNGKDSKYSADHISVVMGGRLALTRVFAALDSVRLGYRNPDYTAYEDIMNYHPGKVNPVEIKTKRKHGFNVPASELESVLTKKKLDAFLLSNPCNPTGYVLQNEELKSYVNTARKTKCTFLFDEFYSHFIYDGDKPGKGPVSAAEFVEDVDKDPVILIDGLTKSFRYPGWRVGWIVGPKEMIENINRAASAIDGGPSQPMMRAALKVLEKKNADLEVKALRKVFSKKKNLMMKALEEVGIECLPCNGTFYIWGNISKLPESINHALPFFHEALKHKVMTVPGYFFDVKSGKKKKTTSSFDQWVRFSFGPTEENVIAGLARLTEMIKSHQNPKKKK